MYNQNLSTMFQQLKKAVKWYFEHYAAYYDDVVKSELDDDETII